MRKIVLSLAVASVLGSGLGLGAARGDVPPRAFGPWVSDASRLLQATDQALADLGRLADDPKGALGPNHPNSAPFRSSLSLLLSLMDRLAGTLAARDPEFFSLLDQGSVALGGLRVGWAHVGVRNDAITADLRLASASYRLLRATYGLEGLRHAQGGALSDAERRQFQRLQRAQRQLAAHLERLRDQARRRKDAALAAELDRFRSQATLIAWAPLDLDSYLNALIATSEMRGEWRADAPYVRKAVPVQDWSAADRSVGDLWVDADIGKVFMVDLGKAGDVPAADQDPTPAPAEGAVLVDPTVGSERADEAAIVTGEDEPVEDAASPPDAEDPPVADDNGVVEEEDLEDAEISIPEVAAVVQPAAPAAEAAAAEPAAGEKAPAPAAAKETRKEPKKAPVPTKAKPAKPAPPAVRRPKHRTIG